MTLTEFLAHRYDEIEDAARAAGGGQWIHHPGGSTTIRDDQGEPVMYDEGQPPEQDHHVARHDPAATLADLAVKRELLDLYDTAGQMPRTAARYEEWQFTWVILHKIVLMEAARYKDHPDYDTAWRWP